MSDPYELSGDELKQMIDSADTYRRDAKVTEWKNFPAKLTKNDWMLHRVSDTQQLLDEIAKHRVYRVARKLNPVAD